ncbi:MAG: hypothetical protein L0H84_15985 [Pseudonocardia sp.]|nr:hypothetical protein [Pseudonocardia sp.]
MRTGIAAAVLTAMVTAGVVAGGSAASADEGGSTPAPTPITLTAEESAWVCEQRIPHVLERIDRLADRADGDASVWGSTAWLQRRADDARAAGRTEAAERLQRRVDHRPVVLERLDGLRTKVLDFEKRHCS